MNLNQISGVYAITNSVNNKCYIGSSKNLGKRISEHTGMLRNGKHHSIHLQRAWNKNGAHSFTIDVIENCEKERLIDREQNWIDFFKPEYNINKKADNCLGTRHSEETKEKIRKIKLSFKPTQEAIEQGRATQKRAFENGRVNPFKSKKHSESIIKFLSQINSLPVVQCNLEATPIKIWSSIKEVTDELGFDSSTITKVCKGKKKTSKGFKWQYIN